MRLTLLRAKEALQHKAPADRLEYRINRVVERFLASGKYAGSLHRLAIAAPYGQLTLPRQYRTVEGLRVGWAILEIANQWYEMLPGRSGGGFSLNALRDLGDGHPIIYDLPLGDQLAISYTGSDDWPVTIYGTDSNALPVTLTIANQTAVSNPFTHIDRIHKEFTDVSVRVFHIAADLTETTLALMSPREEETFYRRYLIDYLTGNATNTAEVLAKLRHIEFTSDQDVLPITNIGALENGMDALQYEAENDVTLAKEYWDGGIDILNKELFDTNGADTLPVIRFIYPGNTTPRLQSFY